MATPESNPLDASRPVGDAAPLAVAVGSASVFLANLHHAYAQTDGSYAFPNSREGDMLKTAKREIEQLRAALSEYAKPGAHWAQGYIARKALSPNAGDVARTAAQKYPHHE